MSYSHASRDLRNRNDIYSFIPAPQGYLIPSRKYGAGPDLSDYLKRAGWVGDYLRPCVYTLTPDLYRKRNPLHLYDNNYPKHSGVYAGKNAYSSGNGFTSAYGLEKKLFLN